MHRDTHIQPESRLIFHCYVIFSTQGYTHTHTHTHISWTIYFLNSFLKNEYMYAHILWTTFTIISAYVVVSYTPTHANTKQTYLHIWYWVLTFPIFLLYKNYLFYILVADKSLFAFVVHILCVVELTLRFCFE